MGKLYASLGQELTWKAEDNIMKPNVARKWGECMDVRVGDILEMKKQHPCGSKQWLVLRVGMDFRLRCRGCGHELMLPRVKAEKAIKKIERTEEEV